MRRLAWPTFLILVLAACGGSESDTTTSTSATTTTAAPAATTTTAVPTSDDPFALSGPVDINLDTRCNVNVFREDETGTTWLIERVRSYRG